MRRLSVFVTSGDVLNLLKYGDHKVKQYLVLNSSLALCYLVTSVAKCSGDSRSRTHNRMDEG